MTSLSVVRAVSLSGAAVAAPTAALTSTALEYQRIIQYVNETGKEIARRIDWGVLAKTAVITGDGTAAAKAMPADFARLQRGAPVKLAGAMLSGALSDNEFAALTAVAGTPRYFNIKGGAIAFWPTLANAVTASVDYISKNWTSGGGEVFVTDAETALFNERLLELGSIARWRRQLGLPFADHMAEFEAALADFGAFGDSARPGT